MAATANEVRSALLSASLADAAFWDIGARPSPIDIAGELCLAMDAGRFSHRGKTLAQTVHTVLLSREDFKRFDDRSRDLVATLKDAIAWWARSQHYETPGDLRVRIVVDECFKAGQVSVEAGLRDEESARLSLPLSNDDKT